MVRRSILLAAVTAVLATAAPAISATYAEPDGEDHPYVVLLTFYYDADGDDLSTQPLPDGDDADSMPEYPDDYQWRCTGTLIAPDLVLTAGHCTEGVPYGADGQPSQAGPQEMTLARVYNGYDSETTHPAVTDDAPGGAFPDADFVHGVPVPYPDYDDSWSTFPETHDVGLVRLAYPIVLSEWGIDTLPTLVEPGALASFTQRQLKHEVVFETVGYGLQWIRGPWRFDGDWVRHRSWSTYVNSKSANNADRYGDYNIQTSNNNGHTEGGSCFGDSGGPVFLHDRSAVGDPGEPGEPHQIVAVVSFGMSPNCTGTDFSYRVDREPVQDFIWDR